MNFEREMSLSFSSYDGQDSVSLNRVVDAELIDARELANFFSSVSRAMGFDTNGVVIYFGESPHASDY